MNAEGTGYFQENFSARCLCEECEQMEITRATLGACKLAEDLVADRFISYVIVVDVDLDSNHNHPCYSGVIRQGSFVTKMKNLCWTEPGFFDEREDEVALQHAISRYHAYVDSPV
ncbi:hypothetical protein H0H81_004172 [Sphagnurus paluster]|uniref:Uncharacterized protein n=1 Tax=Sphagnurus paluster TaxID=117069 RepID=A0A9P7GHJ3_9AGAR|nr:hypothetical protein H0H81_004172 [Sphagnurus paluster]